MEMETNYPFPSEQAKYPSMVLYGISLLAQASLWKLWTNESAVMWAVCYVELIFMTAWKTHGSRGMLHFNSLTCGAKTKDCELSPCLNYNYQK